MQRVSRLPFLLLIAGATLFALHAQEPSPASKIDDTWPFAYVLPQVPSVSGAPFLAEYTLQFKQPLLSGRTETLHSITQVARDSKGQTRQELRVYEPASRSQKPPLLYATLSDPQSRSRMILDSFGNLEFVQQIPPSSSSRSSFLSVKTEGLGDRTIDGLEVKGIRRTWTSPSVLQASAPPVQATDDTWYSKELHLIVSEQRTDSSGRALTITLSRFHRHEPPASLFKVHRGHPTPGHPYSPYTLTPQLGWSAMKGVWGGVIPAPDQEPSISGAW